MSNPLAALTPIPRGTPVREALTRERIEAMQNAIRALWAGENLTGGNGVKLGGGGNGVRVDVVGDRGRSRRPKSPFEPDIKMVAGESDAQWFMSLAPGWIVERVQDSESHYYNEVDGITGEDGEPFWHEVVSGDSLWVKYNVSLEGLVEGNGQVVKSAGTPDGDAHYHPKGGIYGGAAGVHCVRMAKFELENGRPKVTPYSSGDNIDHYAERPAMETREAEEDETGDRREVLHEYEPAADTYFFRYLLQLAPEGGGAPGEYNPGAGTPIIKPLGEGENPDTKKSIEFRMLAGRETGAQIRFKDSADGGTIRVEGNDVWQNVIFKECLNATHSNQVVRLVIAIRDGISSAHTDVGSAPPVPEGKTLTEITIVYTHVHLVTDPET